MVMPPSTTMCVPGDEGGVVAGQVQGGAGDVLGQAGPGDRLGSGELLGDPGDHLVGRVAGQADGVAEDGGWRSGPGRWR